MPALSPTTTEGVSSRTTSNHRRDIYSQGFSRISYPKSGLEHELHSAHMIVLKLISRCFGRNALSLPPEAHTKMSCIFQSSRLIPLCLYQHQAFNTRSTRRCVSPQTEKNLSCYGLTSSTAASCYRFYGSRGSRPQLVMFLSLTNPPEAQGLGRSRRTAPAAPPACLDA